MPTSLGAVVDVLARRGIRVLHGERREATELGRVTGDRAYAEGIAMFTLDVRSFRFGP